MAGITEIKHKVEEEEIAHHPEMNICFSLPLFLLHPPCTWGFEMISTACVHSVDVMLDAYCCP